MSINQKIEKQYKDKSGSIAKNRLTIQTSYAVKLLVDFFNVDDYVVFLDCVEDVALKTVVSSNEKLYLYQIKTKNKGGYTLTHIINEEWLQKLYKHKETYADCDYEIVLVVDEFLTADGSNLFVNEKANMETDTIEYVKKNGDKTENLKLIKQKISECEGILESEVDLSKFYFIKTNLHIDTHKEQAKECLSKFIEKLEPSAKATKIRAFFAALYNTIDDKFNYELEPLNTDYIEIQSKKGFTKTEFSEAIKTFLNESIPETSELFTLLNVSASSEHRLISSGRAKFFMDLTKQDEPFKTFITELDKFIAAADVRNILQDGFDAVIQNGNISPIYKEEGYVKFALAYRYRAFINGGEKI